MVRIGITPILALAACGGGAVAPAGTATLHAACGVDQRWTGTDCRPVGDARGRVATAEQELADFHLKPAQDALAGVEAHGPLDHDTNVKLWEQRGIAAAYAEDPTGAIAAFDMVLALDPVHLLSYDLSPQATGPFERSREAALAHGPPNLDITWARGQKVGAPVPLEVEVIADPRKFLRRATVLVRKRGDATWQAADVTLAAPGTRAKLTLPGVHAAAPTAYELYARAYDDHDNEVLVWNDPTRPREIPLRYDPPTPWYRKWWVWAIGVGVAGAALSVGVYVATRSPPDTLDAPVGLVSSPGR